MEVPLTDQDAQVMGNAGNYTETYTDQKIRPIYLFVCEICQEEFTQQLKFFEHLKAHYEDMQQTQQKGTLKTHSGGVTTVIQEMPNSTTESLISTNFSINEIPKVSKVVVKKEDRPDELGKNPGPKILLSCPKCRRTFRREKTYQSHVDNCQKIEVEDEPVNYEAESKNKKAAKKTKVKTEVVVVEGIVEGIIEEGLSLEEESIEAIQDPLGDDQMFEGDELLAEDELFSEDGHQCMFCDDAFPSKAKLETHLKKAHSDESPLNGAKTKKKRAVGQRRQDVLKCPQCQRIFNHRNSLVYHMRSHTGERPHQCEMCGKSFFATSALKVHMRLHSGEKPYKCESCGRNFRQWGDLKYHMISIHSDIRQYQCEFCGKDFARKYSLIVHRRIHTGERNYKCEFCNKCFRAASYLQNHRRIHTGEKPHACTICGKPFRVRSDMKRHMASHNRESHHGHSSSVSHQTTQNVQNVVTVSSINNPTQQQIITIGPQITQQIAQVVRSGNSIQVPVSSESDLQQTQQIALEDGNEVVITGDIVDGTPINITLTPEGLAAHSSLDAATVATLQSNEIQDGVLYPNRDGTLETVTIRESNTGTLYVWPVFMN
ncbi:unnamed protein product [Allacma fusca]|uniref:C2H2-type domain-containing protein n=1 Tax=Allacma fusca TaxID=39272 RepID=A0A8J2K290_9HEXA|nr:unnamed protein product [Allacma fusca]